MARKPRIEIEGGLYHIITRGVGRQDIFHSAEDHQKFVTLLIEQKARLPFYFYAYCLMTNHVHLLIERRTDNIGRVMHRVLTGYTQYYNRKYHKSGHVLQGRYKSILCQSDRYLAELVRYIHLNPVRANMVDAPEKYPFSSHRAYIASESADFVDVDPVLRHFGPKKEVARERFAMHVATALGHDRSEQLYEAKGGVLGSDEFVDAMIHRLGEYVPKGTPRATETNFDADALLSAVESVCGISRMDFCGKAKATRLIETKEVFILCGRRLGATITRLSGILDLNVATVSRRHDAAVGKIKENKAMASALQKVVEDYESKTQGKSSELQA